MLDTWPNLSAPTAATLTDGTDNVLEEAVEWLTE